MGTLELKLDEEKSNIREIDYNKLTSAGLKKY